MVASVLLTCQHIGVNIPINLTRPYFRHTRRKSQYAVVHTVIAQHIFLIDIILLNLDSQLNSPL